MTTSTHLGLCSIRFAIELDRSWLRPVSQQAGAYPGFDLRSVFARKLGTAHCDHRFSRRSCSRDERKSHDKAYTSGPTAAHRPDHTAKPPTPAKQGVFKRSGDG